MSNKEIEDIQIFLSDDFNSNDVAEIDDLFKKVASTRVVSNAKIANDSVDSTIIQTAFFMVVVFVGLEISKGFFNSIGSDLKEKLVQLLKTKKKPFVRFQMHYGKVSIDINAQPQSNDEWDKVFETINNAEALAVKAIDKNKEVWGVIANYNVTLDGYWDVAELGKKKA